MFSNEIKKLKLIDRSILRKQKVKHFILIVSQLSAWVLKLKITFKKIDSAL